MRVLSGWLFVALLLPTGISPGGPGAFAEDKATGARPAEASLPEQRYLLQYRFQPNQAVYYDVEHETSIEIKTEGAVETTRHESSARKHYRVISTDKRQAGLLELVIDEVKLSVSFGENDPVVYDSGSSDPPPAQFRSVAASVGKPQARIRFSKTGELLKATPLRVSQGGVGQLNATPRTPDNDPSHNFLAVFPDEPVAVGDTWTDRLTVQVRTAGRLVRPVTLLKRYKLESVDGNVATISHKTSVLTPVRDPDIRTQLIQRTPSGRIKFDLEKGLILSKVVKLDNSEVGIFNGKSSMHVVSHRTERLVDPKTAAGKTPPKR